MNWRVVAVTAAFVAMPLSASSTTSTSAPGARLVHKPASSADGRMNPRYIPCGTLLGILGLYAFIGGGSNDTARGQQSGVLAGYANAACAQFDAIAAGQSNSTSVSGHASFIGAGSNSDVADSYEAFIGAGNGLSVSSSEDGSVVAGQSSNVQTGADSGFVGAGANNSVAFVEGFVGAGTAGAAVGSDSFVGAGSSGHAAGNSSGVVSGAGNEPYGIASFIGAGQTNVAATNGFDGAGTGNSALGSNSFVGAGSGNKAAGSDSFIGAGGTNSAGTSAFVGAGSANVAGPSSFVGAGYKNKASGNGAFAGAGGMAFFLAGSTGANSAAGTDTFVGAGDGNSADTLQSVVTGGVSNHILDATAGGATGAIDAVIGGGYENIIEATASGGAADAVLGGGETNLVTGATAALGGGVKNAATGNYATIPGGLDDRAAGVGSFAAGTKAGALQDGTFVWSDGTGAALNSTAPYQFLARASGGFYLASDATATAGVKLAPGSGAWASLSDRNMKTAILPLDGAAVLGKVVRLPVSEWSYTSERGVRHVGPMAQDFYAAFDVGEDDRHITTIDEDGIALAAIKTLYAKAERNNATALRENDALAAQVSEERRELAYLTAKLTPRSATTSTAVVRSRLSYARETTAPTSAHLRRRPHYTQYCSGTGNDSFVGGAGGGSAAGNSSGILSGGANQACGLNDAIGAGYNNAIYPNGGTDHESFIGAGDNNSIYSNGFGGTYGAFIGAGNSNTVTAWYAGIVAGTNNTVGAAGATGFIGGGNGNTVNAEYGFVGAGQNNQAVGTAAFVGAGSQNKASAQNSGVVSGTANLALGPDSLVGAGQSNQAGLDFFGTTTSGAFVGAGASNLAYGNDSFVGAGTQNHAVGDFSFIGAGLNNKAELTAFVGGGSQNNATGQNSFVGGGYNGSSSGPGAFVGGGGMAFFLAGSSVSNTAAGTDAFVGAGDGNMAGTTQSVVIGGVSNSILSSTAGGSTGAIDGAIGGGFDNIIEATAAGGAAYGVIAGGRANDVAGAGGAIGGGYDNAATGSYSTVPGGYDNRATGSASFAAGTRSRATQSGTFVWSDGAGSAALSSTAPNQFLARASGGFYLFSNAAATAGVKLAPGSGTWASLSDRNMKTAIAPLDDASVLAKVAALPVSTWSYTSERGVRHVGPMAQDFYAAFGVGEDDRHITSIDEDGVALAAIKGLAARSNRDDANSRRERDALDAQQASIQRQLAAVAAKVKR